MNFKYRSYSHLPNEKHEPEIRIEYHNGFWRDLFHLRTVVLVFIKSPLDGKWYHKYIGVPASKWELKEIATVLEMLRQQALYEEHLNQIFI